MVNPDADVLQIVDVCNKTNFRFRKHSQEHGCDYCSLAQAGFEPDGVETCPHYKERAIRVAKKDRPFGTDYHVCE